MKSIKMGLMIVVLVLFGLLLSSCSTIGQISGQISGKSSDVKLNEGILLNNLEMINEALADGANINKIAGLGLFESNPTWLAFKQAPSPRVAEYLINKGADVNLKDKDGNSLLSWMANCTDVHFCELLISHGAKIDAADKTGYTALEYVLEHNARSTATEKNIDSIITLLLNKGLKIRPITLKAALADGRVDVTPKYLIKKRILEGLIKAGYKSGLDPALENAILGDSAKLDPLIKANKMKKEDEQQILFSTVALGNVETLKLLEAKGLDIKATDRTKNTTAIIASYYGNLEMVKYLLDKGVAIEARTNDNNGNKSALNIAVENEQYDVAKYLMEKGANIKPFALFAGSVDVLSEAAETGNLNMLKLIIANGYPLNEANKEVAAAGACRNNKIETLKYFLAMGVNINMDHSGISLLSNAPNLDMVKFLVEQGAKVDGTDGKGNFLNTEAAGGETDIVKYIISKGANVNAVSEEAGLKLDSALMKATVKGNLDIVKLLVENGAKLEFENESKSGKKDTVIITAAGCGSKNILEYLLKKGSKINYQNQDGETALMLATSNGSIDNIKILIKYIANISLKNKNGQTALDIAKNKKNKDIIKLIENAK